MNNPIQNRHDFVLLFDVLDGNPNGDPDAGNHPRIDAETGDGLVTDVCLKRKIRNYVEMKFAEDEADGKPKSYKIGESPRHEIYVKEKAVLNNQHQRAHDALTKTEREPKNLRKWMCGNFYDIRTFGAVMSTGVNCGQVRGPVQMTFARSVAPIVSLEHSITRMAVTTEKEAQKQSGDNRTMGRKHTIPYSLYRAHGFISAHLAADTGFSDEDLALFWEALRNMFEHDRSAARGMMSVRGLYVFKHDGKLGNRPAHQLFDLVKVARKNAAAPPRSFSDFEVSAEMPPKSWGVTLEDLLK